MNIHAIVFSSLLLIVSNVDASGNNSNSEQFCKKLLETVAVLNVVGIEHSPLQTPVGKANNISFQEKLRLAGFIPDTNHRKGSTFRFRKNNRLNQPRPRGCK